MVLLHSTPVSPLHTILEQETYDYYGYWPLDLVPGSHKLIIVLCHGCMRKRHIARRYYKQRITCRHGYYGTPEHNIWAGMKQRCDDPDTPAYKDYGGRGISVCETWCSSFIQFLADVGPRPSPKHSLDRIDNDGNYEPGNVRWATAFEQGAHKRNNVLITFDGRTQILEEWAKERGIYANTISGRLSLGWSIEQAFGLHPPPRNHLKYRPTEETKQKIAQTLRKSLAEKKARRAKEQ